MTNKRQLIYVDDAKRAIEHYDPAFSYVIDNVPIVDAVEVVHGRWEAYPSSGYLRCTNCKLEFEKVKMSYVRNYCPNCGAQMDGAANE